MLLLTSTDTPKYSQALIDYPDLFGWLITPRKRGVPKGIKAGQRWAADNDCYNLADSFVFDDFILWLNGLVSYRRSCLFVPCPDKVANHLITLKKFYETREAIARLGFPVAFVLQDGCEDVNDVPWNLIDAVFVGGTTEYKLSPTVIRLLREANRREKWTHVGRVNSKIRINHFYGFADSFDGTGFSREPDAKLRWVKSHLLWRNQQPRMIEV